MKVKEVCFIGRKEVEPLRLFNVRHWYPGYRVTWASRGESPFEQQVEAFAREYSIPFQRYTAAWGLHPIFQTEARRDETMFSNADVVITSYSETEIIEEDPEAFRLLGEYQRTVTPLTAKRRLNP